MSGKEKKFAHIQLALPLRNMLEQMKIIVEATKVCLPSLYLSRHFVDTLRQIQRPNESYILGVELLKFYRTEYRKAFPKSFDSSADTEMYDSAVPPNAKEEDGDTDASEEDSDIDAERDELATGNVVKMEGDGNSSSRMGLETSSTHGKKRHRSRSPSIEIIGYKESPFEQERAATKRGRGRPAKKKKEQPGASNESEKQGEGSKDPVRPW